MSNDWDEMNDEIPAEQGEESTGMKKLRAAYERQKKQNADQANQLAQLTARERERTLSETLSAKGANPALAKFYPADRESTPEKVEEWLNENAELFGHSKAPQAPAQPQVSEELRQAYDQFQQPGMNTPAQSEVDAIRNFQFGDSGDVEVEFRRLQAFMRQNPNAVHNPGGF